MWLKWTGWFSNRRRKRKRPLSTPDPARIQDVAPSVTAREGMAAVTAFARGMFEERVQFPRPVSEPAIVGRSWWLLPQIGGSDGSRKNLDRLEAQARECEILTWAEIGGSEEINRL